MSRYLGIDIGTSGCKAAVFDGAGLLLSLARREYDLRFTADGGAELDSEEVMEHCLAAIAEARSLAGGRINALAVSSQGEAFTAVGAGGRVLCRAMVSSDTRASGFARDWPAKFGNERLYQITGHTAHPMFTLFKLLWLQEQRPEVWSAARQFLCFEDLLHLRLGVSPAMGWPLAGRTLLFDVRRHTWSPEILAAIGLDSTRLARPLMSGSPVGTTADGVLVVAGGHDQACGALGAGATQAGVGMYATGTVECITPAFSRPAFSESLRRNNLCTYDHAVPGMYATVAFSLTGGNLLKWYRDEFAAGQTYEAVLAGLAHEPTSLLVLPYWTPSGTPYFDCDTPGAMLGLRLTTRRGEILRGLLEGVALEMRLNLEILGEAGCGLDELRAIGGGAKSIRWCQLKADVLGMPLSPLAISESGCLGAAMLACAADSNRPVESIAREWIRPGPRILPDPARRLHYDRQFARYRRLREAVRSGWGSI